MMIIYINVIFHDKHGKEPKPTWYNIVDVAPVKHIIKSIYQFFFVLKESIYQDFFRVAKYTCSHKNNSETSAIFFFFRKKTSAILNLYPFSETETLLVGIGCASPTVFNDND